MEDGVYIDLIADCEDIYYLASLIKKEDCASTAELIMNRIDFMRNILIIEAKEENVDLPIPCKEG